MIQLSIKKQAVFLVILFLNLYNSFAQLTLVSNQNIDFSNAASTTKSGNWSDASIWSNNQVPSATTDVIIDNNHTIYIDKQGAVSNQIVDLCRNLQIKQSAILQMGHNTPNFSKDLRINGSILCNGTFSSGRNQPIDSGDGLIYSYNTRIYLSLNQTNTYISGSGYFHPRSINITGGSSETNVIVDIYNMVLDENFVAKSNNRVNINIERYSYVKVKNVLGLTGSTYQFSAPTAKADLTIKGILLTGDVSLFTKNTTPGESSSITIEEGGILHTQKVNKGILNKKTENAGFQLIINNGGLLKLGEGINFSNLTLSNPNFLLTNNGEIRHHYSETLPNKTTITNNIDSHDPNEGGIVSGIEDVFGASHIAGWYNETDKPYLLEGLDRYKDFGSSAIKTTLSAINGKMYSAYPFNHTWPNFQTLKDVAQHQFIDSLFQSTHIKTHTFWTTSKNKGDWKKGPDFDHESFLNEEQQYYDLTKHLLVTYGSMNKTFVYQNWEGDWMLRGQGVLWEKDPSLIPDDVEWNIEGMARMFRARQRGTERARNEHSSATAKVFNGIEFNKLWWNDSQVRKTMMDSNIPSVIGNVVPATRIDLSSWSAYDGGWTNSENPEGHAMYKGLQIARYFTSETGDLQSNFPVQIGEFAINENPPYNGNNTKNKIETRYGRYIGVALSLGIPNFYLWNLYCSGQQGAPEGFTWEKEVQYQNDFLYEWMDGKWLIEPDGTWGHAANFLMQQWNNTFTANTGNWNSASNWSKGRVPIATDNVSIPADKTVVIDTAISDFSSLNNEGIINVNAEGVLRTNTNFVNKGVINLFSNNTHSAVLLVKGNSIGKITYTRGGLKPNEWSLVMPPVSGQPIKEFTNNPNNDIRVNDDSPKKFAIGYYDDNQISGSKWQYYDENINETLKFSSNRSYALSRATAGSVTFKGTISTKDFSEPIIQGKWNAIGNPFTTYYPANKNNGSSFLEDNSQILDINYPALYIWDSEQAKYAAVSELDNETRSLAPGQGFFVKIKSGPSTIPFRVGKRMMRPAEGNAIFNKTASSSIQLELMHDNITVKTAINFFNAATNGFDAGLDIGNFQSTNLDIFTYLVEDNNKTYTIQSISNWNDVEVPLGIIKGANKELAIGANLVNIPDNVEVILEDRFLNIKTNLSGQNQKYKVVISDNSKAEKGRFYLHINNSTTLNTSTFGNDISIYKVKNTLFTIGLKEKSLLEIYDVLGKKVLQTEIHPNEPYEFHKKIIKGPYIVTLKTVDKVLIKKIFFN
jgi:hypothetical protein